mmetsp:Transcript_9768/g.16451  ORF Transcript_9768/g.16451 Transcript_9768/m.16451 type:complete len:244 (+) Transcript_9768:124-855(+)
MVVGLRGDTFPGLPLGARLAGHSSPSLLLPQVVVDWLLVLLVGRLLLLVRCRAELLRLLGVGLLLVLLVVGVELVLLREVALHRVLLVVGVAVAHLLLAVGVLGVLGVAVGLVARPLVLVPLLPVLALGVLLALVVVVLLVGPSPADLVHVVALLGLAVDGVVVLVLVVHVPVAVLAAVEVVDGVLAGVDVQHALHDFDGLLALEGPPVDVKDGVGVHLPLGELGPFQQPRLHYLGLAGVLEA